MPPSAGAPRALRPVIEDPESAGVRVWGRPASSGSWTSSGSGGP